MSKYIFLLSGFLLLMAFKKNEPAAVIRINQLGYTPAGIKVAVWCSKESTSLNDFELIDVSTGQIAFKGKPGKAFGAYGPFRQTYRLDFSVFNRPGKYLIRAAGAQSAAFSINDGVYTGAADFCLRYMRQQRSGFNPFLKDSCHTHDGFTVYAPVPDGTHINVVGGWHDATDYLQYSTTTANATYHLLAAYRDFPEVFIDKKQAGGLDGSNGRADVLDEAKWGLDWLLKMHPKDDWLFNQLADDRDHKGMRLPKEDTNFYGRGLERPVYFCTGEPQGLLKYKNRATGVASTAGKFASAFALGAELFFNSDRDYAKKCYQRSGTALALGLNKPGVCQTAPGTAPYFYEEDNWKDDMELGCIMHADASAYLNKDKTSIQNNTALAMNYAREEPITPWLGKDTARHYQWYPFINVGHYELAKKMKGKQRDSIISYYREGIERVWNKSKNNAFYRGIPFIWCSNNLTTAFAIQCYWYRELSGDNTYRQLEQACFDWLFGCNPWGTGMVYGLPSWGDTPVDPHSSFTHLKNYPIDGGLVDGPVYTSIYEHLLGIHLEHEDAYAAFQSDLAVYHDDSGDFSTNEPTMDGTAVMIYLLAAREAESRMAAGKKMTCSHGAVIRADSSKKEIALVFTGHEFGEGLPQILHTLQKHRVKAGFFFTGAFYSNPSFHSYIRQINKQGHYLGPHSDAHLLYCDWVKRDSLLVSRRQFEQDMQDNLRKMQLAAVDTHSVNCYIPPYEWWNDSIAQWSRERGLQLVNFTPGTGSNADYTYPEMGASYKTSKQIYQSIIQFNETRPGKLNGTILLIHAGTDPRRKDKFYDRLDELIRYLKKEGYRFRKINEWIE